MNILPKPQKYVEYSETADFSKIHWNFIGNKDSRIVNECNRISRDNKDGILVNIEIGNTDEESYSLKISKNGADIKSSGINGAFYGVQTLKLLLNTYGDTLNCCEVEDKPDMKYRGFYHDVTRGKVPTLDTLKALVDKLAMYKQNSLQLYIEHTFEFKEYAFCLDKFGYLTKAEILELEKYCDERFIELIPSIATFGHLYELLNNEKYNHLSEMPNLDSPNHYWEDRMIHHTINPTLEESFEVVKSLIDQYLEVTHSDKFNICCDETFDLGNGVNKGKDKAELYVSFVTKLINYLQSKGKTVMMWGDIILQHPERLKDIPKGVIMLNWEYQKNPDEGKAIKFKECGITQIMCPGTTSWCGFSEDVEVEENNIVNFIGYGFKHGALGALNTNWGDYGNLASITSSEYGILLGASISWNHQTVADGDFRKLASKIIYGNQVVVDAMALISSVRGVCYWVSLVVDRHDKIEAENYINAISVCKKASEMVSNANFYNDNIKREIINAIDGYAVVADLRAVRDGYTIECYVDYKKWYNEFVTLWNLRNKPSELNEACRILDYWNNKR